MSNPNVGAMPQRHLNVKLLKQLFKLTVAEFDVLLLCERDYAHQKFGLPESQCQESQALAETVNRLRNLSFVDYDPINQVWEVNGTGRIVIHAMNSIPADYPIAEKGKLIEFRPR